VRSLLRTLPPGLARDVAALGAACFVVGLSFGAIAVAAGMPVVQASAMSLFVFAGGAQFLAVGVTAAGGTAVAAVLAGLLLNARHLPFGLAIGDALGRRRLLGSHVMTDETVAFALARTDPAARRTAYWLAGLTLYVVWNVATVLGALAGDAVGDPAAFGIDAAFPAGMLALLLPALLGPQADAAERSPQSSGPSRGPALRDRPALRVAAGGATVALVAAPFLPPGLPVLVALLGLVFALPLPRFARSRTSTGSQGRDSSEVERATGERASLAGSAEARP
jgi:4-azaleucine resistance transporter AzlC